jgi:SAM-dependent methyltransferase
LASSAYDASRAEAYRQTRELDLARLEQWRVAVAPYVADLGQFPLLDLGAGTGVFARAFAAWFNATVVAVEPAAPMWRLGIHRKPKGRLWFVAGDARALPFGEGAFGAAWLSTVIHHIPDLGECANQLHRVLRSRAPVLIRSAFGDRLERITLFRYFEAARRVASSFPTVETTARTFGRAGFEMESLSSVPQVSAPSLRAVRDSLPQLRLADSTLRPLTDFQFQQGLDLIDKDLASTDPEPVVDWLDLVVLRRVDRGRR